MLERGVHLVQDPSDKLTFSAKPTGTLYKTKANSLQLKSGLGPTDLVASGMSWKRRKGAMLLLAQWQPQKLVCLLCEYWMQLWARLLHLYNEFQCLVKQEVSLHPGDITWRHLRRENKYSCLVSLVTAPCPLCSDSWYCSKASQSKCQRLTQILDKSSKNPEN